MAVFLCLAVVAVLVAVHFRVTGTAAYKQALAIALSSSEVHREIGGSGRAGALALGTVQSLYGSQFAEFSVRLAGEHGGGRLYGVANSTGQVLEFSRLSFVPDASGRSIDLTPAPRRLVLPPVPAKKVYLIPLGLDADEPLDWAPPYYEAKFGIDVAILPAVPLVQELIDSRRKQVNSEKCGEYLRRMYPEMDRDPSALLIGVTSRDIYIPSLDWGFALNDRHDARLAVVSSARLRPLRLLARWNPEWQHSRLQKMLTKNIAMQYFDLPLSNDYTSLLSAAVSSGWEVDLMGGRIIGAEGRWDPFPDSGEAGVMIFLAPNKLSLWRIRDYSNETLPQISAHVFGADLALGLFIDHTVDFRLEGDYPLQFTRAYRNQDAMSRSFGIGASDSLDIFLVGQMGVYIDLILEDGGRYHFVHRQAQPGQVGDAYMETGPGAAPFSGAVAIYADSTWTITRRDGSKFYFPYRPKALGPNVTVLTGFTDQAGHKYEMERDSWGALLSVTTPSGQWLHFEPDAQHRFHRISDSSGRVVTYEYDPGGGLSHVADSEGHEESYSYDDKTQMLTVTRGSDAPMITNGYDVSGHITSQRMANGGRFAYHYTRDPQGRGNAMVPDLITDPNGLLTYIQYNSQGYLQSLPSLAPQ